MLLSAMEKLDSLSLWLSGYCFELHASGLPSAPATATATATVAVCPSTQQDQHENNHYQSPSTPYEKKSQMENVTSALSLLHNAKSQAQFVMRQALLLLPEGRLLFSLYLQPALQAVQSCVAVAAAGGGGARSSIGGLEFSRGK